VSEGSITLVVGGDPAQIPGLSGQFTTEANSVVIFMTEGGIANDGAFLGDFVRVDVRLIVDGNVLENRRYDVEKGNFGSTGHWNYSVVAALGAGVHHVRLEARMVSSGRLNAANPFPTATLAGTANTVGRGKLTAIVLNK
jgi:hypothetical protein